MKTAVCTTVYPGVEKYLPDWFRSVAAQIDDDFDLWIALDKLRASDVVRSLGYKPLATFVDSDEGDTPAKIRQKVIELIVRGYEAVVFVDSDDLLEPNRVESAKQALREHDVSACAMRIVDEQCRDLGVKFLPDDFDFGVWLPSYNVFGLGNSAYCCSTLERCLPFPPECAVVDWYLATFAWLSGARLHFDTRCGVAYRQHPNNMARVLPPFTADQVLRASRLVLSHYACVLGSRATITPAIKGVFVAAEERVERFLKAMGKSHEVLENYVKALNQLPPRPLWWSCVAQPRLEWLWKN